MKARWLVFLFSVATPSLHGQTSGMRVKDTVHNLSASGPGEVKALTETRICVFCHTPHNATPVTPLWNRELPVRTYRIYSSSSLRARTGQPTGSSKLCLSCHDGTIALGSVLSKREPIALAGGTTGMPPGRSNLGTDLSDDHPVSFSYGESAAASGGRLAPAAELPPEVRLDPHGDMQCTSCHDPHENTHGAFLVLSAASGVLCVTCHRYEGWRTSAHETSPAPIGASVASIIPRCAPTVAENGCRNCHVPHSAGSTSWILHQGIPAENCLLCHDGSVAGSNIAEELRGVSAHPVRLATFEDHGEHDRPTCTSCHNPHLAGSTIGQRVGLPASLVGVPGIRVDGAATPAVAKESEFCYRCHGDSPVGTPSRISRQVEQGNTRFEFDPSNPSFHPVESQGVNQDVPSLRPPRTIGDLITCSDCHNSPKSRRFGGSGPDGPHGSTYPPILARRYDTFDYSAESPSAYGLCYHCHDRDSILRDQSFSKHGEHIVDERTPCSVCHDPHGVSRSQVTLSDHTHLMNFDLSVVAPDPVTGRLEFRDLGQFRGECYLLCHGEAHSPETYAP